MKAKPLLIVATVTIFKDDRIAVLTSTASLKQFSKDGIADSLFGKNGKISVPFEAKTNAVSNNKIIVVGTKDGNFAVARYRSSGKLDKTWFKWYCGGRFWWN